jgi:hypothetical protein
VQTLLEAHCNWALLISVLDGETEAQLSLPTFIQLARAVGSIHVAI